MKEVLHILPHLRQGGAEQMAVHLMSGLDRERYMASAIVLGQRSGSRLEALLESKGVPITFLGKGVGFDPRILLSVSRALRRSTADVIHTHVHVLRYTLPGLLCSRKRAILHTVHNLAEREVERRAQWLQKLAFRRGVVPVACSKEVASSLDRRYGLKQVQVIANCIPVETYRIGSSAREEWRKAEGFSEHSILLTCVALFRQQKNHRLLLEAFASGPAQNPRVHLVLAGSGPTKLETRKQADALQISDRVHFLGLRDDIAKLLGASDVFVLASEYEGNPLAVMEAMACGIPVVSTGVGGVPELVRNGREGIIVPPGDRDALANALIFMIDHENERRAMGAKALERATKQFDVSIMVRAYENLYDQLCTPRPVMTSVLRAS